MVQQEANQNVWQRTTYETTPSGRIVAHPHSYTELATGLNHLVNSRWIASSEQIDIAPDGSSASATNGQHQAYFPGNIYQGTIQLVTPDGKTLQSQPIGLGYDDGSNAVLIAVLTNSTGAILPTGNQVIYTNAFAGGFAADLLYTYTKAGFEQDVVLREAPLTPESYGLNSATTRLQILTEFFNPPQPALTTTILPEQAGIALTDENLGFGLMSMMPGRAFLLGADAHEGGVLVSKSWVTLEGRQFLVEEVPVEALADELGQLPVSQTVSVKPVVNSVRHVVSARRLLPAQRTTKTSPAGRFGRVAQTATLARGLVLDYVMINTTQTNYVYQGDTTYYISGNFGSYGTNTFEGGAVLKFATNGEIQITPGPPGTSPGINWKAGAYRPVIFTAKDDNSVGETITNSTGSPFGYYGNPMLYLAAFSPQTPLIGLRLSYAKTAIQISGDNVNLYSAQFVNCQNGFCLAGGYVLLDNALFANVMTNFIFQGGVLVAVQNATFSGSMLLASAPATQENNSLTLTNCILANVTNLLSGVYYITNGGYNGFYNTPEIWGNPVTNNFYPFQSVGAGNYYLATNSPYRNAGTTNIDPNLLTALPQKTTYPPIVYNIGGYFSTSLNLSPQAQRDTDVPDLGYHYDPLDYIFGTVYVTNATIAVNPGTAVAVYGTNQAYGFGIGPNAQFLCQGSPNSLAHIVQYNTVQEQTPAGWITPSDGLVASSWGGNTINCRFTDWSVMAQDAAHVQVSGVINPINLQDCQFHGGKLITSYITINLTNCLLERVNADLEPQDNNVPVIRNNLIWRGTFGFAPWQTTNSVVRDNLFDRATIPDLLGGQGNSYVGGHNAYVTNCDTLDPIFPGDIILSNSPAYQSSWLGNYYLPTNSPLIHAGSTTANQVGLYHYTVTTNQLVEGTNMVSIGYHYVAVDTNSIPIDTNGDGIPDYLEDANGNGLVDSGEIGWNIVGDLGLQVIITRPRNGSTLP